MAVNTEVVYNGSNNYVETLIKLYDPDTDTESALIMSDVDRMTATLIGELSQNNITIDSDIDPAAFDWTVGSGKLRLYFGMLNVPAGTRLVRIKVYDPNHASGQVIIWEHGADRLLIQFEDAV